MIYFEKIVTVISIIILTDCISGPLFPLDGEGFPAPVGYARRILRRGVSSGNAEPRREGARPRKPPRPSYEFAEPCTGPAFGKYQQLSPNSMAILELPGKP